MTDLDAARSALAEEEAKMNAGKPNDYRKAYERFCKAQRAAERSSKR